MPPTRALVGNGVLIGRLQQGFPSSPGVCGLTYLQHGRFRVHEASEMRRVEVPLRGDPTGTGMPALVEWFLDLDPEADINVVNWPGVPRTVETPVERKALA